MSKMPFLVPEVLVEGERTVYHFSCAREFVRGSRTGLGPHITRQDNEKMRPLMIGDLIGRVPEVTVPPIASGSSIRIIRGGCEPASLDGILVKPVRSLPLEINIDDMVGTDDVEGIKVCRGPAATPAQFSTMFTGCGAIPIWTRRLPRQEQWHE